MAVRNIIYIGKDERYWKSLQDRFLIDYPKEKYTFHLVYEEDEILFQRLLPVISSKNPHIIFVDYSSHPTKLMTLARLLHRSFSQTNAIIGLWDIRGEALKIKESNITGVFINHIKSGEFRDIIFHANLLSGNNKSFELPKVATGKIPEPRSITMNSLVKIGFMGPDYIHIEHDINYTGDENIKLVTSLGKEHQLVDFKLKESIDKNFYYGGFKHASDFTICYDDILDRIDESNEKVLMSGTNLKLETNKWFKTLNPSKEGKRIRALVIDHEMLMTKQADKPFDEYPFSFRFYKEIDKGGNVISRVVPGIIAYQYKNIINIEEKALAQEENDEVENAKVESDDSDEVVQEIYGDEALQIMVKKIKESEDYLPIIIVFNSSESSEDLQGKLDYKNLLTDNQSFDFSRLLSYCNMYHEKDGQEMTHAAASNEARVYFEKSDDLSNAISQLGIHLHEISESFTIFSSALELPFKSVFYLEEPVNMCLTIIPRELTEVSKIEGEQLYFAVNHCLTEGEREKLRRYVNEIHFLPKMQEKQLELDEFEEKKVSYKETEAENLKKEAAKKEAEDKAAEEEVEKAKQEAAQAQEADAQEKTEEVDEEEEKKEE